MFPRSAFHGSNHHLLTNAKFFSKFGVRYAAVCISLTTLFDYCLGQLSVRMRFAPHKRLTPQGRIFPTRPKFGVLAARVVIASQNTLRVLASPVIITVIVMTFKKLISVVVLGCSKKQMERINTRRIIASMANAQIKRVNRVIDFVCDTRGYARAFGFVFLNMKTAITASTSFALPLPTTRGKHNNFRPKAINDFTGKGGQDTMFNRHNLLLDSRLCLEGFSVS